MIVTFNLWMILAPLAWLWAGFTLLGLNHGLPGESRASRILTVAAWPVAVLYWFYVVFVIGVKSVFKK